MKAKLHWNKGIVSVRIKSGDVSYTKSLHVNVNKDMWDVDRQIVRGSGDYTNKVNMMLGRALGEAQERLNILILELGRLPSSAELKQAFTVKQGNDVLLCVYAEAFIETMRTKTNNRTGETIAPVTINKHLQLLALLRSYENNTGARVLMEACSIEFYHAFAAWLNGAGYASNTVGKYMSIIKSWLREAEASGLKVNPAHRSQQWRCHRERKENIHLTDEELIAIVNLPLHGMYKLVRDCFVISAYTGLRYSDIGQLASGVVKDGKLYIESEKTLKKTVIALNTVVVNILSEYAHTVHKVPMPPANAVMNRMLKDIARMADINSIEISSITSGGKRITEKRPKYELVTTHTARRTFARSLFLNDFGLEGIMVLLGHSKPQQTLDYIGGVEVRVANKLQDYWVKLNS